MDGDVRGIAVHVGARLADLAEPGETWHRAPYATLVAGSGVRFGEDVTSSWPGSPGTVIVSPVIRQGVRPDVARRLASEQANVFRRDGEYLDRQLPRGSRGDASGQQGLPRRRPADQSHASIDVLDLIVEELEPGPLPPAARPPRRDSPFTAW